MEVETTPTRRIISFEDDERNPKRVHGDDSPPLTPPTLESHPSAELESSMKKVRISRQLPGQIRLAQDVKEGNSRMAEFGLQVFKIDQKNPLHATLQFAVHSRFPSKSLSIEVERHYPHKPPIVRTIPEGNIVMLPLLANWLPVNTIVQVLEEICKRN